MEGRNVLPDATDDQALVIEMWAGRALAAAAAAPLDWDDERDIAWHKQPRTILTGQQE
jgi:hypothetical protein